MSPAEACKRKLSFTRVVSAVYRAHLEIKRHGVDTYVYRCRACGRWHLTTKPGGDSIAVRRGAA